MTMRTWGAAGQVGEWYGTMPIPPEDRPSSLKAVAKVLMRAAPVLQELHRPRRILISWGEYDDAGSELAFHELEEIELADWTAIANRIEQLPAEPGRRAAFSCLFVQMDTSITERDGEVWEERSAELQLSVDKPFSTESVVLGYVTYLDVWLSTTYGDGYAPRPNNTAAERNRPRLESVLRALGALWGETARIGQSQLYPFAICETGFRDADQLPILKPT
jgi:hypothetical protein